MKNHFRKVLCLGEMKGMDINMEHLVRKAKKGDAEAFISLIENQRETLKRVAYAWLKNEEDAADAIQDTILDAYEHIGQLNKADYFRTWIVRILINNCTRIYRKNKNYAKFEISADEYDEECYRSGQDNIDAGHAEIEFYDLLRALPEDSRVIFQMYFGEQFTTAEIARLLHMKENTVKSRIHRGKEELRKQINKK